MKKAPGPGSAIGDYAAICGIESPKGLPVVVGGQAANAWAIYYASRTAARLSRYRPFTSKDLDLAGDRDLLEAIQRVTNGDIHYSGPRTPVVGYVEAVVGNTRRKIEVLRDVKGLRRAELDDAVDVIVDGLRVRLLAPVKVLKAKICNSVTLDQSDRNDVNHVRIMIECVREFLNDILVEIIEGRATQRDMVNFLEELREVVLGPDASKAAGMWDLDFTPVWPMTALRDSGMRKIQLFLHHRLAMFD